MEVSSVQALASLIAMRSSFVRAVDLVLELGTSKKRDFCLSFS
jgi:hypothetical protein